MAGMIDVGMGLITDPLENECEAVAADLRRRCARFRSEHDGWEPRPMPTGFGQDRIAPRRLRAIDPLVRRGVGR